MPDEAKPLSKLYILQPLSKGFSIFYFVLLPVFFSEKVITTKQIGYIGAIFIAMLIFGAVLVFRWLHNLPSKKLLLIASGMAIFSALILLVGSWQNSLTLIIGAYAVMGMATGTAMSGVNALAANFTTRGDRFYSLAKLGSATDLVRIIFPIVVVGAVAVGASQAAILIILLLAFIFFAVAFKLPNTLHFIGPQTTGLENIKLTKPFRFIMSLEFADSFASSQLFVFLPLLFLAKGYNLEKSLILQSFIFLGYFCGRWLISFLAKRYSGIKSIAYAEIGMILCIFLVLISNQLWFLYLFIFILGIFARGTAPTIKAMAFDTLHDSQMKKGSAVHVIVGDSGSAIGQLAFGFLIAWYGVNAPFIVAAIVAGTIALTCFIKPVKPTTVTVKN